MIIYNRLGSIPFPALIILAVLVDSCVSMPRFGATRKPKTPPENRTQEQLVGYASYYADEFHGRTTANGETYDMHAMTAAHRSFPFGTRLRVTNNTNGKSVVVRINDRGPFKDDRIIDVSLAAAKQLGMIGPGTVWVELEVVEMGSDAR